MAANPTGADSDFDIRILSDRSPRNEDPITGSLNAAVGQVCDLFSDEECYNYFKAAEYEVD